MTKENIFQLIKESKLIKSLYKDEYYNLIDVKKYKCIFYPNCWIAIFDCSLMPDYLCFEVCEIKDNEVGKHFSLLPSSIDNNSAIIKEITDVENCRLLNQINLFKMEQVNLFQYDINHDGIDEIISFFTDYIENVITIYSPKMPDFSYQWIFKIKIEIPNKIKSIEFINYKCRQGIKFFDGEQFVFYYYDRIKQEYVQDEAVSSEELEQIHGSPDFFAEAGIDYTKLERTLVPSDLEGFSKPALRIWRNAIYARHGRTFKSEDLQALFNEYVWYSPDENYSDEKLSDIDKANIKLIQEFEKR